MVQPFQLPLVKPRNRARTRRLKQRDALWPKAEGEVFQPSNGGWCQVPRTVPMIASLIDDLGGKEKPGRLYITLWSYDFGEGYLEVPDPARVALEAGYKTNRAERTFVERMRALRELGFIRSEALGAREFGHVLLVDPHRAVLELWAKDPTRISDEWWSAFQARCSAIGIELSEYAAAAVDGTGTAPAAASPMEAANG